MGALRVVQELGKAAGGELPALAKCNYTADLSRSTSTAPALYLPPVENSDWSARTLGLRRSLRIQFGLSSCPCYAAAPETEYVHGCGGCLWVS